MLNVKYNSYEELIDLINASEQVYDLQVINKAYDLAKKAHLGQKRKSGIDYIYHPISVAYILVQWGMDSFCVAAALLHDVVEDTDFTKFEIEKEFGKEIATLVDGVTKLKKISSFTKEEQQAENINKMLEAMLYDIRVIMIKLADVLNNMRTIDCMPKRKRVEKSLQNMEIFAPIAHRLGMRKVKDELETISLKNLDPIGYEEAAKAISLRLDEANEFIKKIGNKIAENVKPFIPSAYVEGRVKSINEIYKKMFVKGKSIEQIYDVYALRIIVNDIVECYSAFGIMHNVFQPIPNRFKDYISTPKRNMYQSLHTTVLSSEAIPFEIQIRTWDMHKMAECGIAAHWKYKLNLLKGDKKWNEAISWVRKLLNSHKHSNDVGDVLGNIKSDLMPKEIFVLTPKGKVINLPMGATVVDFAYFIHTELGNRITSAKVNNKIVPITYQLKTGEIVEVISSGDVNKGPSREWFKFVKTGEARSKIRQWLKKFCREENIVYGKNELKLELQKNGIDIKESELENFLKPILISYHCSTAEDFYDAIGYGGIELWKLLGKFKNMFNNMRKNNNQSNSKDSKDASEGKSKKTKNKILIVDSVDGCSMTRAKCCMPLPGDDIVVINSKKEGRIIHKSDCSQIKDMFEDVKNSGKIIYAEWAEDINQIFSVKVKVECKFNSNLIDKITKVVFLFDNLKFKSFNYEKTSLDKMVVYLILCVESSKELDDFMREIMKIDGVNSVSKI